jgi:hypothetical protein
MDSAPNENIRLFEIDHQSADPTYPQTPNPRNIEDEENRGLNYETSMTHLTPARGEFDSDKNKNGNKVVPSAYSST